MTGQKEKRHGGVEIAIHKSTNIVIESILDKLERLMAAYIWLWWVKPNGLGKDHSFFEHCVM